MKVPDEGFEEGPDPLLTRLDRLERGLRRWRLMAVLAWAVLAAGLTLNTLLVIRATMETPAGPEEHHEGEVPPGLVEGEVRAGAFVLVDEEGRVRAALALREDGNPALAFSDERGTIIWKAP